MGIFEFSFSKLLLFPFICPVFNLGQDLLLKAIGIKGHIFMISSLIFFGEMLSIFIELIAEILQRREKRHSLQTVVLDNQLIVNNYQNEMDEQLKEKQKNLKSLMFFSCLLEFIANILMTFFLSHPFIYSIIQLECKAVPLFSIAFLNKFISKVQFEKHNIFAMLIILFGASLILIVHFLVQRIIPNFFEALLITILFMIVKVTAGTKELLDTYILQAKYASPFKLLFYQGLFGFIASLFCAFVFSDKKCFYSKDFDFCTKEGFIDSFKIFLNTINNIKTISYIILLCLMVLALNVFRMQTKVYLTIFHRVLSCITTAIVNWVLFVFFWKQNQYENSVIGRVFEMIGFIIILFGELVYAEVIICKFKGLSENTKKEIIKRGELDRTDSMEIIRQSIIKLKNIE